MRALPPTLTAIAVAAALTGCGGSAKPSAKACWTNETRSELTHFAGSDEISKADRSILVTSVNAYASGATLPGWLPPEIKPWLHQTQQRCGKL